MSHNTRLSKMVLLGVCVCVGAGWLGGLYKDGQAERNKCILKQKKKVNHLDVTTKLLVNSY